jgi:hypothetical protein
MNFEHVLADAIRREDYIIMFDSDCDCNLRKHFDRLPDMVQNRDQETGMLRQELEMLVDYTIFFVYQTISLKR